MRGIVKAVGRGYRNVRVPVVRRRADRGFSIRRMAVAGPAARLEANAASDADMEGEPSGRRTRVGRRVGGPDFVGAIVGAF